MVRLKIFVLASCVAFLYACASVDTARNPDDLTRPLVSAQDKPVQQYSPPVYFSEVERAPEVLRKKVHINEPNGRLIDVLTSVLPGVRVLKGGGVNLRAPVSVYMQGGTVAELLEELSANTGYDITMGRDGKSVRVDAVGYREWNLSALAGRFRAAARTGQTVGGSVSNASSQSSGGGAGAAEASMEVDNDQWESIVNQARQIMGLAPVSAARGVNAALSGQRVPRGSDSAGTVLGAPVEGLPGGDVGGAPVPSSVVAVRSTGVIQAYGPPDRLRHLDRFLKRVAYEASRLVRLDVKAIEVTLSDARGQGIDWNLLLSEVSEDKRYKREVTIGGSATQNIPGAGVFNFGLNFDLNTENVLKATMSFLGRYGQVRLKSQPSVTVTNGHGAMFSNVEEIPYIASVTQTASTVAGGAPTVTPTFERLRVGVSIAVTPRIQDDGRILLDVVPVISALKGFDSFKVGDTPFEQPRVVAKELATQIWAESGQTRFLGGLISDKVDEVVQRIPRRSEEDSGPFDALFHAERNELARTEVVILITATIVN